VGHVRTNNEDVWRADTVQHLYAVADGMGGHDSGEVAAELCIDVFFREMRAVGTVAAVQSFLASPTLTARRAVLHELRRAAASANLAVLEETERRKSALGLGCTLDAVLLLGNRAFVLHVGDGRVYLAREAATIQLTNDHDLRSLLAADGRLALSQRGSIHNQLLNAIGMNEEVSADCTFAELAEGDRLVLCTDGVHGMVGDEKTFAALVKSGTPQMAAERLVEAALAKGGRDNATALVLVVMEEQASGRKGLGSNDLRLARSSPLLVDLPDPLVMRALTMSVEVELPEGRPIPRVVTTDSVAYVLLEGEARLETLSLGPGALLYAESLVAMAGGARGRPRYTAATAIRALRLRADDFREVCASDARLAAALYERLARHFALLVR
jgi:serine/threonine protein phosphatase PrpC